MDSSESSELLETSNNSDPEFESESESDVVDDDDEDKDDDDLVARLSPAFFLDLVFFLVAFNEAALGFLFRLRGLRLNSPSDSSAIPKWARASSARYERS